MADGDIRHREKSPATSPTTVPAATAPRLSSPGHLASEGDGRTPLLFAGLAACVAGHTLLVHHRCWSPAAVERSASAGDAARGGGLPEYSTVRLVLAAELLKLVAGVAAVRRRSGDWRTAALILRVALLRRASGMLDAAVPALIYTAQNNLVHVALNNLDPATFQVTSQLKILWTALFMWLMLGKRFSARQKVALLLLCAGETLVHVDSWRPRSPTSTDVALTDGHRPLYLLGLGAALLTCVGSGFAGVFFERMLRGGAVDVWVRFVQVNVWGVLANTAAVAVAAAISHQWLPPTAATAESQQQSSLDLNSFLIVVSAAGVGILTTLVVQRLDSIWKNMASSAAVVMATLGSALLSDSPPGGATVLGTALVVSVPWLYNDLDRDHRNRQPNRITSTTPSPINDGREKIDFD